MNPPHPVEVLPADDFNRSLIANAHPPDWVNPTPAGRYNLVVVGAGTAGLVAAAGAAILGARVALIERHLMGGDCLTYGCVPSKALIRASRIVNAVKDARSFGVEASPTQVDFAEVMRRVRGSGRRSPRTTLHNASASLVWTFIWAMRVLSIGEPSTLRASACHFARPSSLPARGLHRSRCPACKKPDI